MTETKRLLGVRKTIKSKKPEFLQQDFHKKRRMSRKWKRPTGLHSKMRHQFKGYLRRVKQGWRSPEDIRGYHGKGMIAVMVYSVKDLTNVDKNSGIIIAKSVGLKKRLEIINKAAELKITVLNVKPESVKTRAENLKTKKQEKQKQKQEKKKSLEEAVKKQEKKKEESKKAEEKNKAAEDNESQENAEKSEEEKKKEEKKLKDDVLIHSQ